MSAFAAAADTLFADPHAGVTARYWAAHRHGVEAPVKVRLIPAARGTSRDDAAMATVSAAELVFALRTHEAANALPGGQPDRGDEAEFGGAAYRVDEVARADGGHTWLIGLTRMTP
jgi:hypothetical protein